MAEKSQKISLNFSYPHGRWSIFNDGTAYGKFLERNSSQISLLNEIENQFKNTEERDFALFRQKPLGATILALQVAAFEDYLRELYKDIRKIKDIEEYFIHINCISSDNYNEYFKIGNVEKLNKVFEQTLGFKPINSEDKQSIEDRVTIRHIVFHFWGIANEEKAKKLESGRYSVLAGEEICPNFDTLKEENEFFLGIARRVNENIYKSVLLATVCQLDDGWDIRLPEIIIDMLSVFGFFGHRIPSDVTVGKTDIEIRKMYLNECVNDIKSWI